MDTLEGLPLLTPKGTPRPGGTPTGTPAEKAAFDQLKKLVSKASTIDPKIIINDQDYPLWRVLFVELLTP